MEVIIMPLVGGKSSIIAYFTLNDGTTDKVVAYRLPIRSESINPSYSNIVSSEALLGKRTPVGTFVGGKTYEGSIDLELFDFGDGVDSYNEVLGVLAYAILGKYEHSSGKVSFNTEDAAKFLHLVVNHEDSQVIYDDVLVTGFNLRFPTDGVPTVTLDVKATKMGTTVTTPDFDYSTRDFSTFYNAKNLKFIIDPDGTSNDVSNKVYNFELSLNQNVLDYYTYGSLNPRGIEASTVDLGEITLEYYPEAVDTIDLDAIFETAFANGTPLAVPIELQIESPLSGITAKIRVGEAFVVEYNHDISGNEYITATLGLRASAEDISVSGVKIDLTA